jgi:hypothetical protein
MPFFISVAPSPLQIGAIPNLQSLSFRRCAYLSVTFEPLRQLQHLTQLLLIDGHVPACLSSFTALECLAIIERFDVRLDSGDQLAVELGLSHLQRQTHVDMSGYRYRPPAGLGALTSLRSLCWVSADDHASLPLPAGP